MGALRMERCIVIGRRFRHIENRTGYERKEKVKINPVDEKGKRQQNHERRQREGIIIYTQKNFSKPCYQVRFCTELVSTGAIHSMQLGFAPIVYPPWAIQIIQV
jgi:hypothetical protein